MKKLQQFYILKFNSDRLKNSNYNIDISLDNARKNGEVVTINNSELLRTLFRYKNIEFSQKEIDNLLFSVKKLKKLKNSEENSQKIKNNLEKIEKILFVEDLVNVEFKHKAHYLEILKRKGFYINGTRYTPFLASAGMIRKNTAMFINNNIKHQIMDILENGRDESVPMVATKFGTYFSLYSSTTLPVSFPNFAVIPDKEIETERRIDFVQYRGVDEDDDVTEITKTLKLNAWDGQGLISPTLAQKWSEELELDYVFSSAVIRAPFLKGLVTVFDFHHFAQEIAKKYTFTDVYGIERDIRDVDLLISESMFKLWNTYKDTKTYIEKCNQNSLGFSIAKVNPKREASSSRTSYQFLQVLNLSNTDIAKLCEPTVSWFRNISGGKAEDMLIYATGETNLDLRNFHKMDISVKAIAVNPTLARDRYIQNRFIKTIEKKKKESFIGNVFINANYQFMISDPYYQACHVFGLEEKPLLKEKEYYSEYWINRGIKTVGAIRSPIVHHSEFNILNFKENEDTRKWYKHIHSGIIFPANGVGIDCAIHGGADFDGDLICTINNPIMISGKIDGLPIVYESKKAEKEIVDSRDDKKQVLGQLNGHNSKVGFATNISSSIYCMLEDFPKGTLERQTLEKRLKIGRVIQGEIIDGVKGLEIPPFRNHWTKYKKITEDMSLDERYRWEFNNRILCEVRPAFFKYLYPHYMTRYKKELKRYNVYCMMNYGKTYAELLVQKSRTKQEEKTLESYKKHSFFLDNSSVVNRIYHYMEDHAGLVNKYSKKESQQFDYQILMNKEFELNPYKLQLMKKYLQEYVSFKKSYRNLLEYESMEAFLIYLRKECITNITSNEEELANYAVEITYGENVENVEFPWRMFGSGILENIIKNSNNEIKVPVQDDNGEIEYLWNRYTIKTIEIKDLYETEYTATENITNE